MSDEEASSEEEVEVEAEEEAGGDVEEVKKPEGRPTTEREESREEEAEFIKLQHEKRSDLDEQLKEYIQEWRKQRAKEEEELVRLKDKQAKRKTLREQEEKRLAEKKRQEEERRVREVEEKKQRDQEEKLRRLEEAERKRQLMLQAQKASLSEKGFMANRVFGGGDTGEMGGGARQELLKTKEQLEEEKKISMSFRIKALDVTGLSEEVLKKKASEFWEQIVRLETEKYDLEERQKRQEYDLKELKERQKQQLRHKALKRGLDPEALTGKFPPKLQVASKYERRVDTRSYGDKKNLFEGDLENSSKEILEKAWAENIKVFEQRQKAKLPKWFGERPGKKKDAPDSPDEQEVKEIPIPDMLEEPNFEEDDEETESAPAETKAEAEAEAKEEEEEDEEDEEEEEEEEE